MAEKKKRRKAKTAPAAEPRAAQAKAEEEQDGAESRKDRFIILLRHGLAEDKTGEKPDADRSLTKAGHARMKQIARGISQVFPKAEAIYSSPLLRCVQTALWISRGYRGKLTPKTVDVLAPSGSPRDVRDFLDSIEERRVILIGHEPNLTETLAELTRLSTSGSLELKKGGCYGVRLRDDGSTSMEWLLTPRVLRRLGD